MNNCINNQDFVKVEVSQQIIDAMLTLVRERDPYTAEHCVNVAKLSCLIAKQAGCSENQIRGLYVASMLHDIGKTSVPSEILSKSGVLSQTEWEIIKTHSYMGCEITKKINFPWPVSEIILQHHERIDGSGYPQALPEKEIMMESRILAVADVIDAMMSHRPYRPALNIDSVLDDLENYKGIKYDIHIAEIAINLITQNALNNLLNVELNDYL